LVNEYTQPSAFDKHSSFEFKLKLLSFLKDSIIQQNNCAKFCKYAFALLTIVQVLLQIRQTKRSCLSVKPRVHNLGCMYPQGYQEPSPESLQ